MHSMIDSNENDYSNEVAMPTGSLRMLKFLFNSIISTPVEISTFNIKNSYINTLHDYFVCMNLHLSFTQKK